MEEAVGEVLLLEEVEQEVAEEELHLAEEEGRVLSAADKEMELGKMIREIITQFVSMRQCSILSSGPES